MLTTLVILSYLHLTQAGLYLNIKHGKMIPWDSGGGNIHLTFTGQGNGSIVITATQKILLVKQGQRSLL